MYQELAFRIQGVAPLILHNGQLSDPLNPWVKAMKIITAKKPKDKTDADLEELSRLEWYGSLYTDEDGRVVVPGINIEGLLRDGGMKQRLGPQFKAGIISEGNWPIEYDGPRSVDDLWKSGKFRDTRRVGLKGSSIMRTRPIFHKWALKFVVMFLPDVLNKQQIVDALETAGKLIGLCDYTPRFGRFVPA